MRHETPQPDRSHSEAFAAASREIPNNHHQPDAHKLRLRAHAKRLATDEATQTNRTMTTTHHYACSARLQSVVNPRQTSRKTASWNNSHQAHPATMISPKPSDRVDTPATASQIQKTSNSNCLDSCMPQAAEQPIQKSPRTADNSYPIELKNTNLECPVYNQYQTENRLIVPLTGGKFRSLEPNTRQTRPRHKHTPVATMNESDDPPPTSFLLQGTDAFLRMDGTTARFKHMPAIIASPATLALESVPTMCSKKLTSVAVKANKLAVDGTLVQQSQTLAEALATSVALAFAPIQELSISVDALNESKHTVSGDDGDFVVTTIEPVLVIAQAEGEVLDHLVTTAVFCLFGTYFNQKERIVTFTPAPTREQQKRKFAFVYRKAQATTKQIIIPLVKSMREHRIHTSTWMTDHILAAILSEGYGTGAAILVTWTPYLTDEHNAISAPTVYALNDDARQVLTSILWLPLHYVALGQEGTFSIGTNRAQDEMLIYKRRELQMAINKYPDIAGKGVKVRIQGLPKVEGSSANDDICMQLLNAAACASVTYLDLVTTTKSAEIARDVISNTEGVVSNGAHTAEYNPVSALGTYGLLVWQTAGQTTGDGGAVISTELANKLCVKDVELQHDTTRFILSFQKTKAATSQPSTSAGGSGEGASAGRVPTKKRPKFGATPKLRPMYAKAQLVHTAADPRRSATPAVATTITKNMLTAFEAAVAAWTSDEAVTARTARLPLSATSSEEWERSITTSDLTLLTPEFLESALYQLTCVPDLHFVHLTNALYSLCIAPGTADDVGAAYATFTQTALRTLGRDDPSDTRYGILDNMNTLIQILTDEENFNWELTTDELVANITVYFNRIWTTVMQPTTDNVAAYKKDPSRTAALLLWNILRDRSQYLSAVHQYFRELCSPDFQSSNTPGSHATIAKILMPKSKSKAIERFVSNSTSDLDNLLQLIVANVYPMPPDSTAPTDNDVLTASDLGKKLQEVASASPDSLANAICLYTYHARDKSKRWNLGLEALVTQTPNLWDDDHTPKVNGLLTAIAKHNLFETFKATYLSVTPFPLYRQGSSAFMDYTSDGP
jgi:hypothetical protein